MQKHVQAYNRMCVGCLTFCINYLDRGDLSFHGVCESTGTNPPDVGGGGIAYSFFPWTKFGFPPHCVSVPTPDLCSIWPHSSPNIEKCASGW